MPSMTYQNVSIPLTRTNEGRSTGGRLYGHGSQAVILSNMNTNNQDEWSPLIEPLIDQGFMVLTYDYADPESDQWEVLADVISFIKSQGAERLVLIGASRGGVTSMQVMARSRDIALAAGVSAISSPVEHEGAVFFTPEELRGVTVPKLFINTEGDECAAGTIQMFEMAPAPKEMVFYQGQAHGTEIFATDGLDLIRRLVDFANLSFSHSLNKTEDHAKE